jgi:hypothetical protein
MARSVPWSRKEAAAVLGVGILLSSGEMGAQVAPEADLLRRLQARLEEAQQQDSALLAPARFASARKLYEETEASLRKGARGEAVRARLERALESVEEVRRTADAVRKQLADVIEARDAVRELDPALIGKTGRADEEFAKAAAQAEAGDAAGAERSGRTAREEYGRIGVGFLRDDRIAALKKTIEATRGKAPDQAVEKALQEAAAYETRISRADFRIGTWKDGYDRILDWLYPPFYRSPPDVLLIDGFTVYVEAFETRAWDFRNGVIVNASGTGWTSFQCSPSPHWPFIGLVTSTRTFHVVETVKDPLQEIEAAVAQKIDPAQRVGAVMELKLPSSAKTALQISEAFRDLVGAALKAKGDIKVRFENLTIEKGPKPGTGHVLAGGAFYPTAPPAPTSISLPLAGFKVTISQLKVSPKGAVANGVLEFPDSIVDPGTGHPGRVDLGSFAITQDCRFHEELPGLGFGPWSVGNTGMEIRGTGVVADFDKSWAAPGLDPASAAAQVSWRGAILLTGDTVAAGSLPVSNTGYLAAPYAFSKAEVTAPGLKGSFTQTAPFEFETLQPAGYRVSFAGGWVKLLNSAVDRGELTGSTITAPKPAARSGIGPVIAQSSLLSLSSDLELVGDARTTRPVQWGEYTKTSGNPTFYEVENLSRGEFYLSGTNHTNYFPVNGAGQFVTPVLSPNGVRTAGMRGLTLFEPRLLRIFTPDTPGRNPLVFQQTDKPGTPRWLNISFGGVHAELLDYVTEHGSRTDLGPTQEPFYVGKEPFRIATTPGLTQPNPVPTTYRIDLRVVTSATYDSNMRGKIHIPAPVDADLEFQEMAFTSTAEISGAKLPFNTPFPLSYWGLDMVKKPGAASGGVICVKTGQVFFTAAGIREQRHFAQPFYLIWGEMLANGALNRLIFDYSGVGQKFDRFPYKTAFVKLSEYDPSNPTKEAFLKTAGTAHFDVFGAKYIQVDDAYDTTKPGDPWNKRRIDRLSDDMDAGGLYKASDKKLSGEWSGDFGSMDFDYDYDKNAQDGFLGSGKMGFLWINGLMTSSIVLKAERICMSVRETERRDFKLGPVAHFGQMVRTAGCGCIENGQLKRLNLSAELETQEDANIAVRAATYGSLDWSLTPSVSTLEIAGDMYVTVLLGGNLEVSGRAVFTVDRANDFVEGELDGRFDTGTALGASSITGDGQVNWHLGTLGGAGYQAIQGKIALKVVSPVGGETAEGGIYVGINAPKAEAWVLAGSGDKFKLNMSPLPARLTGLYGYAKASSSIDAFVFSGGIEAYAGLGGFVLTPAQVANLGAQASGLGPGLPFVVGHAGIHVWGDILGGLVSAGGWVDLNVIAPYPFSFQGTLGLEGCVVWVVCGSVDVSVGLNSQDGLYLN